MSELPRVEVSSQRDLDEDTDSLADDEDQDNNNNGLGDELTDFTSVEGAIVTPTATKLPTDDDDFRPAKRRKAQENNEGTEIDEVVKMKMNLMHCM